MGACKAAGIKTSDIFVFVNVQHCLEQGTHSFWQQRAAPPLFTKINPNVMTYTLISSGRHWIIVLRCRSKALAFYILQITYLKSTLNALYRQKNTKKYRGSSKALPKSSGPLINKGRTQLSTPSTSGWTLGHACCHDLTWTRMLWNQSHPSSIRTKAI